ncbi:MAG: flagellar hook capping protein [Lachnospiraceae bacterium]|nr:flagellar hook capping protein [Lachnospiraceae bacterium]
MALVASIVDGKVVETPSQSSLSNTKSGGTLDKDSFLQLLVAQMQYQDPLEPTSNTEYVAQYAQFSQVESLNNMASGMDLMRANGLVGQEVYIKTTSATGETNYVQGKVDYVVYEGGKPYLSIKENLYSLEDLDTVVDSGYQTAYDKAYDLTVSLNKLPALATISISGNGTQIDSMAEIFEAMSDYEKSFLTQENVDKLQAYIARLAELRAAALTEDEAGDDTSDDTQPVPETDDDIGGGITAE